MVALYCFIELLGAYIENSRNGGDGLVAMFTNLSAKPYALIIFCKLGNP